MRRVNTRYTWQRPGCLGWQYSATIYFRIRVVSRQLDPDTLSVSNDSVLGPMTPPYLVDFADERLAETDIREVL